LEKIELDGEDLYLPTAPSKLVRGIQVDSGIPLQSAAKVPIMITFNVVDRDGDKNDIKPQACIFKVVSFQALTFTITVILSYTCKTLHYDSRDMITYLSLIHSHLVWLMYTLVTHCKVLILFLVSE
jgi:hypothetical protein